MGLTTEYRNKTSAIGQWLRYTFGLTFLSAEEVGNVFSFILMEEKPQDQRVDSFADYLVETYIDEGATYPPIVWAAKTADLSRTTNSCESFHSRIGKYIATPHPNIFTFVESLNGVQTDTYIRKNSAKCNEKVVKRKEVLLAFNFINSKISQLTNGEISQLDFLKCTSYKFDILIN